jgi:hypothetical protein
VSTTRRFLKKDRGLTEEQKSLYELFPVNFVYAVLTSTNSKGFSKRLFMKRTSFCELFIQHYHNA